ncbi:phosphatidylinositol synthase [Pisolithus tinctorius]|nr:phosphatidylinositol synthase [Pisolithus tinctorius]
MTRPSNGSARAYSSPAAPAAGTAKAHRIRRRGSIDIVDAKVAVDLATAQSYTENVFFFGTHVSYSQGLSLHFMSYHPRYCTLLYGISSARALGQTSKFGAVLDMVTDRCTTSCLLCYLSSAYPSYALLFQFLIALDFSSHYMHMYSDVSRILWYYYNDPRTLFFMCAGNELFFVSLYLMKWIQTPISASLPSPVASYFPVFLLSLTWPAAMAMLTFSICFIKNLWKASKILVGVDLAERAAAREKETIAKLEKRD